MGERASSEHDRVLAFGFPPTDEQSAKRLDATDLAARLSERVGMEVRAHFAPDYRAVVEDMIHGRIDVAWLGPLGILRAGRDAVPVLVTKRAERTSYHAAVIARRDAGIASIADLEGRRVGWVDEDSAAGYVFPRALIALHRHDVDAFLGEQPILGSHRAVIEAILSRAVDAGATFVNYDDDGEIAVAGWYEHFGERRDEIVTVSVTNPIPHDMVAVRASLEADDRAALIAALCAVATDNHGRDLLLSVFNGAQGFAPVEQPLLEHLALMAEVAGWPGNRSS